MACLMQGSGELDTEFKAWARGDEWVTNTQLILAAPEMYQTLKDVHAYLESVTPMLQSIAAWLELHSLPHVPENVRPLVPTNTRIPIMKDIESVLEKIDS